jgi:uncharacterized protein with HEPN domain
MSDWQWRLFLEDILNSANRIIEYTNGLNSKDFFKEIKTYDAVMRNFQIIGEAVKHIPKEIRDKYKHVEWKKIAGLRDVIVHEYFGVKDTVIWDAIKSGVPEIKIVIESILEEIQN